MAGTVESHLKRESFHVLVVLWYNLFNYIVTLFLY